MKFAMLYCEKCLDGIPNESAAAIIATGAARLVGDIEDGGIVHSMCEHGHSKTYVLTEPSFVLMFEMASLALIDGYFREAVLGITTAFERLYVFCVHAIADRHGVGGDVFHSARKTFKLSERQFGAFCVSYMLETKRAFDARGIEKFKELRNDTAHEGYIPTREQAVEFGSFALVEIQRILREIFGQDLENGFAQVSALELAHRRAKLNGKGAGSLGRKTVINTMAPSSWGQRTFGEALEELQRHRSMLYATEV